MMKNVAINVSIKKPAAAKQPTAEQHQTVTAVVKPCMLSPSLKIMPAHKKPIPVTTCPIILVTSPLPFSVTNIESKTKIAAPNETKVFVLKPADLWCHCLSNPMKSPAPKAAKSRNVNSMLAIVSFFANKKQYWQNMPVF